MYSSRVYVEKKATWSHVPWTAQGLFFFSVRVLQPARFGYTGATKLTKFETYELTTASQDHSHKPQQEETSKKGFLWGGSDGVDHVAIEVLQHGVANRGSPKLGN